MIQKVLVTPIIGLPQVNGWAQVTESSQGQFVCAFSIAGLQAGNVGRDLVDIIQEAAPDSSSSVYSLIKKIVRFAEEKDCQVQLVGGFFSNNESVFAAYNGGLILKRNEKVGEILFARREIKLIEGQHIEGDIFVLLTKQGLEFKGEIIQKLSQGLDADTTVASIVPGVQNLTDSSLVSIGFVSDQLNGEKDQRREKPIIEFDDKQSPAKDQETTPAFATKKMSFNRGKLMGWLGRLIKLFFSLIKKFLLLIFKLLKGILVFFLRIFSKDVYLEGEQRSNGLIKKNLKYIVGGVVGLLLIVVPAVVFKIRIDAQTKEARESIAIYLEQYDGARTLVEENPIEARESIVGIIDNLKAKQKAFEGKSSAQKVIAEKLTEVEEYYDSISGKEEFQELDTFFDFVLVESGFVANQANLVGETAFFFDKDKKQLIKLELTSKKFEKFSLEEAQQISDLGFSADDLYVLGGGVFKKKIGAKGELSQVIDEGKANRNAKFLEVFGNNLYVLSTEQRNIFKYSYLAEEEKYADPVRWVKSAQDLDFAEISSMVVDGDIWLTTKQGYIFKLTKGVSQDFVVKGLSEPFSSPTILFTSIDLENLYVLEPAKSRLVVLNKSGEFIKEIKSISLASANDLLVSEEKNKALVVSGSMVFEVGL